MNLAMKGIVKSFGANDVLKTVDFRLNEGEICGLKFKHPFWYDAD